MDREYQIPTEGQITPFDIFSGKPRILRGTIESPNCKVGIYAIFGGRWTDPDGNCHWSKPDHVFLFQEGEKWRVWHRTVLPAVVKIDKVTKMNKNARGVGEINRSLRQPDRSAGGYPSLAHPDDKCSVCGHKAYWTQWCFTTVSSKTNGRIIHLCKECTINGTKEHSKLAYCKLGGKPGTDRLLYEIRGEDHHPSNPNLRIKLRINSKNLHMLNDLTINYRRWSELRDDQVIVSESDF